MINFLNIVLNSGVFILLYNCTSKLNVCHFWQNKNKKKLHSLLYLTLKYYKGIKIVNIVVTLMFSQKVAVMWENLICRML